MIDQEKLPFFFEMIELGSVQEVYDSICSMKLRGAPAIGAAGAFGMYLATLEIAGSSECRNISCQCGGMSYFKPSDSCKSFLGCKQGAGQAYRYCRTGRA